MSLTGILFLACFLAGLALAVFRHPAYGLYTYLAVFYLDPATRWWSAALPDLRWSLLAAVVTMIAAIRLPASDASRPPWYSTAPAKILICFTIWMWVQNFWAIEPEKHLEASILFTKYVILFLLIYRLVRTQEQMRLFFAIHVAGCFYLGWLGFISPDGGRLEGVGGPGIDEANALAMHLGTAVMLGSMIILTERKWAFWLSLVAMPFILNAIVLSGSRGAFLALVGGGIVLWFLKPMAYRRVFIGMASLALALFAILAHEIFWERMGTIEDAAVRSEETDISAESRFILMEAQWEMAKANLLGYGHRGTEALSPFYLDEKYLSGGPGQAGQVRGRSSHNTFMTALVEQGIPGAVAYLAMLLWCVRTLRRLRRTWRAEPGPMATYVAGIGAALAVVFVAGIFVDYIKTEVQIWLFALLASAQYMATHKTANAGTLESQVNSVRSYHRSRGTVAKVRSVARTGTTGHHV